MKINTKTVALTALFCVAASLSPQKFAHAQYLNTPPYNAPVVHRPPICRAVPIPEVLQTGKVIFNDAKNDQLFVNWHANDTFIKTYKNLLKTVIETMRVDNTIKNLLIQNTWQESNRHQWERTLAEETRIAIDDVPGLDRYRTLLAPPLSPMKAQRRTTFINAALGYDIEKGSYVYEMDCEFYTFLVGCLMQEAENEILKDYAHPTMQAKPYYYLPLQRYPGATLEDVGYHACLLTSSGGIVECVSDPSEGRFFPYLRPVNKECTFDSFMQNAHFFVTGSPYGLMVFGRSLTLDEAQQALKNAESKNQVQLVYQ